MLSLDEARVRLLSRVRPRDPERVPLREAAGRVLAENLVAASPLPPFDHSAMDGYAVATSDFAGSAPYGLRVVGESRAGKVAPRLAPGTACRISTGAPLPAGADAVVMQEVVEREGDHLRLDAKAKPRPGQHIRRAGEDMPTGGAALAKGKRLSAGALALAGMLDRAELVVARRPRVTILCTGDELRAPGEVPRLASIPESNSAPLAALAARACALVRFAPIVRDDPEDARRAIDQALEDCDVLLTVGGVSVGDHDLVRPVLERAGVTLDFWKVAIKPGKPIAVGSRGATHVLGLPGNPASAIVTFGLFGLPLLRALQADSGPLPSALPAYLAETRKRSPDRVELVRASLQQAQGNLVAHADDNQSSGAATSLATSDGLAFVPPGPEPIEAGTALAFVRWDDM